MKAACFLVALSSVMSIIATPSLSSGSNITTIAAPDSFQPPDIEDYVDSASPGAFKEEAAAATQYWVCIVASTGSGRYGWSRAGSESSAKSKAKKNCGRSDCTLWSCAEKGCVGIDYGSNSVSLSYAIGYGSKDGTEAGTKALAKCKKGDTGCGKPGHFCSQYVV